MDITLINCNSKLLILGIDMNAIGSFDKLWLEISNRLPFNGLEYDFPPIDQIIINVDDGTTIPDLSDFGEVLPNADSMG